MKLTKAEKARNKKGRKVLERLRRQNAERGRYLRDYWKGKKDAGNKDSTHSN